MYGSIQSGGLRRDDVNINNKKGIQMDNTFKLLYAGPHPSFWRRLVGKREIHVVQTSFPSQKEAMRFVQNAVPAEAWVISNRVLYAKVKKAVYTIINTDMSI
jgi:hypothetical protein